ncbi:hypothetical protein GOD90_10665 [Sinorhizobium medicae]|nr:hypothetical protein [Sinorhizobium medicae]
MQHETVDNPELMCTVYGLSYNFVTRAGLLVMGEGNCCDMSGCINLFQRIDPNVQRISTVAWNAQDTIYERRDTQWIAVDGRSAA